MDIQKCGKYRFLMQPVSGYHILGPIAFELVAR